MKNALWAVCRSSASTIPITPTRRVIVAGPFLGEDGATMIGSLIVLDVKTRAEAESWARNDPYAKAGLFDRVEIHPWKHLIGGLENPQATG